MTTTLTIPKDTHAAMCRLKAMVAAGVYLPEQIEAQLQVVQGLLIRDDRDDRIIQQISEVCGE